MSTCEDTFRHCANISIPNFVKNFSFNSTSLINTQTEGMILNSSEGYGTAKFSIANYQEAPKSSTETLSLATAISNDSGTISRTSRFHSTPIKDAGRMRSGSQQTPSSCASSAQPGGPASSSTTMCAKAERHRSTVSVESNDGRQLVVSYDAPVHHHQAKKLQATPKSESIPENSQLQMTGNRYNDDKENNSMMSNVSTDQSTTTLDQSSSIFVRSAISGIPRPATGYRRSASGSKLNMPPDITAKKTEISCSLYLPTPAANRPSTPSSLAYASNRSIRSEGRSGIPLPTAKRSVCGDSLVEAAAAAASAAATSTLPGGKSKPSWNLAKNLLPIGRDLSRIDASSALRRNSMMNCRVVSGRGPVKTASNTSATKENMTKKNAPVTEVKPEMPASSRDTKATSAAVRAPTQNSTRTSVNGPSSAAGKSKLVAPALYAVAMTTERSAGSAAKERNAGEEIGAKKNFISATKSTGTKLPPRVSINQFKL